MEIIYWTFILHSTLVETNIALQKMIFAFYFVKSLQKTGVSHQFNELLWRELLRELRQTKKLKRRDRS